MTRITENELRRLRALDVPSVWANAFGVVFATGAELDAWHARSAGDARPKVAELHRILGRMRYSYGSLSGQAIRADALKEFRAWQRAQPLAARVPEIRAVAAELKAEAAAIRHTIGPLQRLRGGAARMRLAAPEKFDTPGRIRAVDAAKRRVQVIVSTNAVARDGAMIDQLGWNLSNYDRSPVVLWNHDDKAFPIAKAIPNERKLSAEALVETHEFATHEFAENVFQLVRNGVINATSVRWLPGETQMRRIAGKDVLVFTKGHELLEVSYVNVPADPGALVIRHAGGGVFDPRSAQLTPA